MFLNTEFTSTASFVFFLSAAMLESSNQTNSRVALIKTTIMRDNSNGYPITPITELSE